MAIGDKIAGKISGTILPLEAGIVVNSYYARDTSGAYVDVVIEDGTKKSLQSKVPVLKIGGVSISLPPVGSTAIIGYIGNNEKKPVAVGFLDSEITQQFVNDEKRPRKPPTNLTR